MKFILLSLLLGTSAFAAGKTAQRSYFYQCECASDDCSGEMKGFDLFLKGEDATVYYTTWEDHDDMEYNYAGKLDPTYEPKNNVDYVRYIGFENMESSKNIWILVQKALRRGGKLLKSGKERGGQIKVESRDRDFISDTYNCSREVKR